MGMPRGAGETTPADWAHCTLLGVEQNQYWVDGYVTCKGVSTHIPRRVLQDVYEKFIGQLRWDVDVLLGLWFGEAKMTQRPMAWNVAAGVGGEGYGVMGAGFDLVAVELDGRCEAEFPASHPDTGASATFVQSCLWKWLEQRNLEIDRLPDLFCGGLPCAGYSSVPRLGAPSSKERWVDYMRQELEWLVDKLLRTRQHHLAWWLENVPGAVAHMANPSSLCGAAMGLPLFRHRAFDSNFGVAPVRCQHDGMCISTKSPYRQSPEYQRRSCMCGGNTYQLFGGHVGNLMGSLEEHQQALGMWWDSDVRQLHQCIPLVYALYMGRFALQFLVCKHLNAAAPGQT
jgi:hypothetical protein